MENGKVLKSYLLENVAGLVEHFLQVSKQLIQLLAAARHKVAKPGKHLRLGMRALFLI